MTKIKDISIIILIVFLIASILYGIHMFRYEYVHEKGKYFAVHRIDRITNDVCLYISNWNYTDTSIYGKKMNEIKYCEN